MGSNVVPRELDLETERPGVVSVREQEIDARVPRRNPDVHVRISLFDLTADEKLPGVNRKKRLHLCSSFGLGIGKIKT
jgi:hypothetical protein